MIVIPLRSGAKNAHQVFSIQLGENLVDFKINWNHLTNRWGIDLSIDGVKKLSGGILAAGGAVNRYVPNMGTLYFLGDDATLDNLGSANQLVWDE